MFFKERWYGFDDALYAGARLLEILSATSRSFGAVLEALPDAISTPELQLKTAEGENYALVERLKTEAKFDGAREVITIDGVRVEYADGFGLARAVEHHAGGRAALRSRQRPRRSSASSRTSGARCWP